MRRGNNSIISFIALLLILYFIGLPILIFWINTQAGSVDDMISILVDLFPFGNELVHMAIQVIGGIFDSAVSYHETKGYLTVSYVLGELSKAIFAMVVFEVLNFLGYGLMALNADGRWNNLKKMVVTAFNALIAACLSPWVMHLVLDQIQSASSNGMNGGAIISTVVSRILFFIVAGGGMAIAYLVLGMTIAEAIIAVLVKKVAVDFFRLMFSYLCILIALLGLESGNSGFLFCGAGMMLAVALIFAGIDLMLESVSL